MITSNEKAGLYTDFYELTMAEGYYLTGKKESTVTFDYFFRTNPYKGGFAVFAGLQDFLDILKEFTFSPSDIDYLRGKGFKENFLDYLKTFRFNGTIHSVREGEIVFPGEPLIRIDGNIIECQLIESLLLNIINFETLIASKSFRIALVAGERLFADFGLRRAHGIGAIYASRAAYIGGAASTSNVLAGKLYDIPVSGTQAHSWIQSFDSELEAFREFAGVQPENSTLLVDTYDTLKSGIPNAIIVAREMGKRGHRLNAIRLDSGDLAYLSKEARKMLDNEGLNDVKIFASNQLNEFVIKSLLIDQKAPIDAFGVGTELITGKDDAALDGVYKLAAINDSPKMKFSENIEKTTLPGKKQLLRYFDAAGKFYRDAIALDDESPEDIHKIFHPVFSDKNTPVSGLQTELLLKKVFAGGRQTEQPKSPDEINKYLKKRSTLLPDEYKRFISPHLYKTGISEQLKQTRDSLVKKLTGKINNG